MTREEWNQAAIVAENENREREDAELSKKKRQTQWDGCDKKTANKANRNRRGSEFTVKKYIREEF